MRTDFDIFVANSPIASELHLSVAAALIKNAVEYAVLIRNSVELKVRADTFRLIYLIASTE